MCAIELIQPISLSIYHGHNIFIGMRIDVGQGRLGPCSHCLFAVSKEVQHLASDKRLMPHDRMKIWGLYFWNTRWSSERNQEMFGLWKGVERGQKQTRCRRAQVLKVVPGRWYFLGSVGGMDRKQDHSRDSAGSETLLNHFLPDYPAFREEDLDCGPQSLPRLKYLSSQEWELAPSTPVRAKFGCQGLSSYLPVTSQVTISSARTTHSMGITNSIN